MNSLFLEVCRKLISADSSPQQGTLAMAELAASLCEDLGLETELQRIHVSGVPHANVIARPRCIEPEGELLLQTRLDTVDPGIYGQWTLTENNPFNATICDDKIYGLGVAETKLDYACKLFAIKKLLEEKGTSAIKKGFVLAGTFGQEGKRAGAVQLLRRKKIFSKQALVGAPTSLRLHNAANGEAAVEIQIPFSKAEKEFRHNHDLQEISSSQSRIFTSENAILEMFQYLQQLPESLAILELDGGSSHKTPASYASLEVDNVSLTEESMVAKVKKIYAAIESLEKDFANYKDENCDPPQATLNIGMVRTRNDSVILLGNCRIPPGIDQETYERWMREIEMACQSVQAQFHITDYLQPFRNKERSSLQEKAREALGDVDAKFETQFGAQWRSGDANVLNRLGVECLLFGPGDIKAQTGSPNEFVDLKDLERATQFYEKVLAKVCFEV